MVLLKLNFNQQSLCDYFVYTCFQITDADRRSHIHKLAEISNAARLTDSLPMHSEHTVQGDSKKKYETAGEVIITLLLCTERSPSKRINVSLVEGC